MADRERQELWLAGGASQRIFLVLHSRAYSTSCTMSRLRSCHRPACQGPAVEGRVAALGEKPCGSTSNLRDGSRTVDVGDGSGSERPAGIPRMRPRSGREKIDEPCQRQDSCADKAVEGQGDPVSEPHDTERCASELHVLLVLVMGAWSVRDRVHRPSRAPRSARLSCSCGAGGSSSCAYRSPGSVLRQREWCGVTSTLTRAPLPAPRGSGPACRRWTRGRYGAVPVSCARSRSRKTITSPRSGPLERRSVARTPRDGAVVREVGSWQWSMTGLRTSRRTRELS